MNDVLVDSSFLYALYDQTDLAHKRVIATANLYRHRLLIPYVVLTEVAYLFDRNGGTSALQAFIYQLIKANYRYEILVEQDFIRVHQILSQYADAKFDFVDCCLMALAERHGITIVCTLDQRDFTIFRPIHADRLELLP